ncbi:MAG: DUF1330 domain-containing protein [Thiobacillaceae bacterium]
MKSNKETGIFSCYSVQCVKKADSSGASCIGEQTRQRVVVVIKFPSEKVIQEFLNDPEYKPVKDLRLAITTNANAVMAPACKPPQG